MKTNQDQFYIGWQAKAPAIYATFTRKIIIILVLLILLFSVLFVTNQRKFSNGKYEVGKLRNIKGVIYQYPVPMIKVKTGTNDFQSFLLFGFGKSDARQTIELLEKKAGKLEDYYVGLQSELIYYDGKTLLEVPYEENKVDTLEKIKEKMPERVIESLGNMELKGEIVDPKCFFGVMKPGFGKIHRSCASRCISGGIPPVFVTTNKKGESDYFIVIGKNGEKINSKILQFAGIPVIANGEVEKVDDWYVLKIDPEKGLWLNKDKNAQSYYFSE